jgi:hypothetical protein
MNKIKPLPSVASLMLRLFAVASYVTTLWQLWHAVAHAVAAQSWLEILLLVIISIATVFLILGFLTRWAALTIIIYYMISATAYSSSFGFFNILYGSPIIDLTAVWLLNSGTYSIDHLIWKKKSIAPVRAPMA